MINRIYFIVKCSIVALIRSFKLVNEYRKLLTLTEEILKKEEDWAINDSCGDDPYVCGYTDGLKTGAEKYKS